MNSEEQYFKAICRSNGPEGKTYEVPELCHGHLRSRLKAEGELVKRSLAGRRVGAGEVGPGKRTPESLRHKCLLPSLSHIVMDRFQEKHPHVMSDGKGVHASFQQKPRLPWALGCFSVCWLTWSAPSSA